MTREDTGEQAFPRSGFSGPRGYSRPVNGMTLRDYFAGQALAGLCADDSATDNMTPAELAKCSYQLADAMLAARK